MAAIELINTPLFSDANLQFYARFESNWNDSGKNGYNLTPVNTPTFVTGQFGNAGSFVSASSQYAHAVSALTNVTGSQTWGAWIKPANLSGNNVFLSKDKLSARGKQFFVNSTSGLITSGFIGLTTGDSLNSSNAVDTASFHMVICIYDSTNSLHKVWVDSTKTQQSATGSVNSSTADLGVGCDFTGTSDTPANFYPGAIDEVFMFDRALTDTEVTNYFNGTWPGGRTKGSLAMMGIGN